MPYFIIGKEELETRPELVGKLAELLKEKVGRKKSMRKILEIIRKNIEAHNTSYLISLTPEGIPKGFINFKFPREKQAYVETLFTYVSPKFRRQGEATRLTYRLMAIARRAGYKGIYRSNLKEAMLRLSEKMVANPRRIIGKEGKPKIDKSSGKPLRPEDITVFSVYEGPFYRFGSAKITFKPMGKKKQTHRSVKTRVKGVGRRTRPK